MRYIVCLEFSRAVVAHGGGGGKPTVSQPLSVLGIEEFTQEVRMANASNYTALEGYLPLAVGYLILTIPISFLARRLERRMTQEV